MRPFQEFRLWARRAPVGERAATAVAVLLVVGLLGWLVAPAGDDDDGSDVSTFGSTAESGTGAGGAASGSADPPGTAGAEGDAGTTATGGSDAGAATGGSGGTPAGGSGAAPASGAPAGCTSPPGKAKGITDKEIKVVVTLTELLGPVGNLTFNIPPPEVQQKGYEAAIAGINREGGIACRKLAARFVRINPADEASMVRNCREFAASDVYAVFDTGGFSARPAVVACLGQSGLPLFTSYFLGESNRRQFFPFLFSTLGTKEMVYKTSAFALRDLGFFDPARGFKKLGYIFRDCEKEAVAAYRNWLFEAGVPKNLLVEYNTGCPPVFANEADLAQAVLTFQRAGVTHVTMAAVQADVPRFTANAKQQGFRPKYGMPDEGITGITGGARSADPENFANAIAITLGRFGEQHTPGMTPTPATQRCDAYRKAGGSQTTWQEGTSAGNECNQVWMLREAVNRASDLSPKALQGGLQRSGAIEFSYPHGPNDFRGAGVTTGGQFWRVVQYGSDCTCWRVTQREFRRGF